MQLDSSLRVVTARHKIKTWGTALMPQKAGNEHTIICMNLFSGKNRNAECPKFFTVLLAEFPQGE